MIIKTLDVQGFDPAITAMRAPMSSWTLSDSEWTESKAGFMDFEIGDKDKDLSIRLQKAGTEHCKHLRMIHVWADIIGPRFWLIELDTYRAGVEKISTSTMHTLMKNYLQPMDFTYSEGNAEVLRFIIEEINKRMEVYKKLIEEDNKEKAKKVWREIIEILPQSFTQKRIYMFSYAALRNIIRQRKGHKLYEWKEFIDWCRTLPESWMLFDEEGE